MLEFDASDVETVVRLPDIEEELIYLVTVEANALEYATPASTCQSTSKSKSILGEIEEDRCLRESSRQVLGL